MGGTTWSGSGASRGVRRAAASYMSVRMEKKEGEGKKNKNKFKQKQKT
jgi:hypothetical protein